jgi:penicillin-binding protein 2
LTSCRKDVETVAPTATLTLKPPEVRITQPPAAEQAAQAFLNDWAASDYEAMYAMLTDGAKSSISSEKFSEAYENLANEATVTDMSFAITSDQTNPEDAQISYRADLKSAVAGEISREMVMKLVLEAGEWRVDWDRGMILPELAGGNYLALDRQWDGRSSIYDRNGNPLAKQTDAVAIGVWPDYVDWSKAKGLLSMLASFSVYRADTIANMMENALPGAYIPIGEVPADQDPRRINQLASWDSVVVSEYSRRLYYEGGIAPQVIGYVSAIQQEELSSYRRKGYLADDRVGRKGIEQWGEETLMGKPGGSVYVFNPEGKPVQELGSSSSIPGKDIYVTIDAEFQRQVQKAMSYFTGAIVVIEKNTGRVLAMVSSPTYDPNSFETDNYNWSTQLSEITNDPRLPQFNRAAQGQYPLGSVFKIITISAGLESGRFNKDSTYDCQYTFDELAGVTLYDWTWEHFQEDGETKPSGLLTLPQGLIKSCNPWFYHIGNDLYTAGLTTAVSDMARKFGLGNKTGIEGIDEEAGNVPDPASPLDATNLAIGQGDLLVTPLQVARFMAAVGNGGTLYRPQVIEKIVGRDGSVSSEFKPEEQGTLPLKPENLALIQEAMQDVVGSRKPMGTAFRELNDLDIPIAGKTGTATNSTGKPHAWFGGYSFANREDKPDIAVVVIAENAGEGSEFAAPIFRRVMEIYFYGRPLKPYRWEATFDVTRSPTPEVTESATEQPLIIR